MSKRRSIIPLMIGTALSGGVVLAPVIALYDSTNTIAIANGDATPSPTDGTDFGTTDNGTTVTKTYTIRNTGNAQLDVTAISVPSGFTQLTSLPLNIAAGGNATFQVRASAASVATFSGNVSITNNSSVSPYTFEITVIVQSTLNNSLAAYYKAEEATAANRASQVNGYTLTDHNSVAQVAGKVGNALQTVAASSQFLDIADTADFRGLDRDWSFDLWLRVDASLGGTPKAFHKGTGTTPGTLDYQLQTNGTTLQLQVSNGTTITTLNVGSIVVGTWAYVYVEHDSAANLLGGSVNNASLTTTAFSGNNSHLPGGTFKLCCANGVSFASDSIDELGHWTRKLTSTERTNRYNSGNGMTYPFTA